MSQKLRDMSNIEDKCNTTYSKIATSCSLGAFFNPATILCNRLTLCVAEATGVITDSFSFR